MSLEKDPHLSAKSNVYGRSLNEDLELVYKNVVHRNAYSVFTAYEIIRSSKHLQDILNIELSEAVDAIDCLINVGLVERTTEGFKAKINRSFTRPKKDQITRKERASEHAKSIYQILGRYEESEKFGDLLSIFCTSNEEAENFGREVMELVNKYVERSLKVPKNLQEKLINFGVAYTLDNLEKKDGE